MIITEKVSQDLLNGFRFDQEGGDRIRVATPFLLQDNDYLMLILKREGDQWIVSDEGDGLMRLTLQISWQHFASGGTHEPLFQAILSQFQMIDREGELIIAVEGENFGAALYRAAQAILKILDLAWLDRYPFLGQDAAA